MIHELKTLEPYFYDVKIGKKDFEVRFNDRNFQVGDILILRQQIPGEGTTHRTIHKKVKYILEYPEVLLPGYVILGLEDWSD